MKLSVLISLVATIQISASTYSQATRVSINVTNVDIRDAFREIERNSGLSFLYYEKALDLKKTITVNVKNSSVPDLLDELLQGTQLTYKILDNKFIVISPANVMQQKVTGTVTDVSTGEPLPGVSIQVEGTTNGVISDVNGNYSIDIPNINAILVFSYVGYLTEKITASGPTIDVKLSPDIKNLQEVVVVGFGTQKKVNLTGSVSTINGNDFNSKAVTQLSSALEGMSSGVTVTQQSGQPGSDQGSIRIRGIGTINNANPLIVVDGIEANMNTFNNLDASDIESISILKDAASSSIYGVQAANGVILITTKRGSNAKTRVSYSTYAGWQSPTFKSNFVGAQEYMKLVNLTQTNTGGAAIFSDATIAAYNDPKRNTDLYPDVNWMNEILKGSGFQQEHNLAFSGGNEKYRYRFSTGYFDQAGLIKKMDFNCLTARLNTDVQVSKRLNLSADISAILSDQTEPQGLNGGMWFQFGQAVNANPTLPVKYSDGSWGICRGDGNPVRMQEEGGLYDYKSKQVTGKFKLDYEPFKGLTLSGIASTSYLSAFNNYHDLALTYVDFFTKATSTKMTDDVTNQYSDNFNTNFQFLGNYKKDFDKHSINLLAGVARQEYTQNYLQAYRKNGSQNILNSIDAGDPSSQTNAGNSLSRGLLSYFGRINYSFNDKYLLEANIRRDASSRFAPDKRWGTFPSFSAGWRISKESFMSSTTNFLNELKLRGSWGELGNEAAPQGAISNPNIFGPALAGSVTGYYPYMSLFDLGQTYDFGENLSPGARVTNAANVDLTWETTKITNIGLDAAILNNRLSFSFDYYVKKTDNIIFTIPIPESTGLNPPVQNAGSVSNKGWDLDISYKGNISDLQYFVRFNLSNVKNEVTDWKDQKTIIENADHVAIINQQGSPLGSFYGYQYEGIFQSPAQVTNHAAQGSTTGAGDLMYKDIKNDSVINGNDRVVIGNQIPRLTYGLNLGASYKGFDFSAFFQGVGKVDVMTVQFNRAPISQDGNFKPMWEDSWTSDNTNASLPRLTKYSNNYQSSSFWIKSGAYLRLKNIQLGYTLPVSLTKKVGVSKCRVFVGGQNLITWSGLNKYKIDPENPQDDRYYTQVKLYNFGINVEF